MGPRVFTAYGLRVQTGFEVAVPTSSATSDPPDLQLRLAEPSEITDRWSLGFGGPAWHTTFPGGCYVCYQRGQAGDHLITFGRKASFHLSSNTQNLLCGPTDPDELLWQRFLFDTVLHCVSLVRGFEGLHASAVDTEKGAIAFVAGPGGGKSMLAAQLVRRGYRLFADDVLAISRTAARLEAHAGPPLMTLPVDAATGLGKVAGAVEVFSGEASSWVQIRDAGGPPRDLAAIFVLERREGGAPKAIPEARGPQRLLPHSLALTRDPARAMARYGLLRQLTAQVPLYRLQASADADPAAMADVVETTITSKVPPSRHVRRNGAAEAPAGTGRYLSNGRRQSRAHR